MFGRCSSCNVNLCIFSIDDYDGSGIRWQSIINMCTQHVWKLSIGQNTTASALRGVSALSRLFGAGRDDRCRSGRDRLSAKRVPVRREWSVENCNKQSTQSTNVSNCGQRRILTQNAGLWRFRSWWRWTIKTGVHTGIDGAR